MKSNSLFFKKHGGLFASFDDLLGASDMVIRNSSFKYGGHVCTTGRAKVIIMLSGQTNILHIYKFDHYRVFL